MSYEEFDWMEMLNSGKLAKQRVCTLDKYIHKHNLLAVKGKKKSPRMSMLLSIIYRKHTNKQTKLPQCGEGMRHYPFVLVMKTLYWGK